VCPLAVVSWTMAAFVLPTFGTMIKLLPARPVFPSEVWKVFDAELEILVGATLIVTGKWTIACTIVPLVASPSPNRENKF